MKVSAITALIWVLLAATAMGQAKSSGNGSSASAPSKASLAEVRSVMHELEGKTEKLREELANHRSLAEQRPQSDEALAKWDAAIARSLIRLEAAYAALIETTQRLDKSITGELPTNLAKDVARVRNEAEPQRAMAEQVLKSKPAPRKPAKGKQPAEKAPPPSNNEDYDL